MKKKNRFVTPKVWLNVSFGWTIPHTEDCKWTFNSVQSGQQSGVVVCMRVCTGNAFPVTKKRPHQLMCLGKREQLNINTRQPTVMLRSKMEARVLLNYNRPTTKIKKGGVWLQFKLNKPIRRHSVWWCNVSCYSPSEKDIQKKKSFSVFFVFIYIIYKFYIMTKCYIHISIYFFLSNIYMYIIGKNE